MKTRPRGKSVAGRVNSAIEAMAVVVVPRVLTSPGGGRRHVRLAPEERPEERPDEAPERRSGRSGTEQGR